MVQNEEKTSFKQRWNDAQPTKSTLVWSVIGTFILTMIIGFNWGGWVTNSTAQDMAKTAAREAVVDRLALICVDQFHQDPEKSEKLKILIETSSYQQDNYVTEQGWATMVGDEQPDRNVSEACAQLIAKLDLE